MAIHNTAVNVEFLQIHGCFLLKNTKEGILMKKLLPRILLVMLAAMLLLSFAVSVSAEGDAPDFTDHDTALGYLESYDENVASDPSFADNIASALATVRQSIQTYASFWALLPPIIAILLALISKQVYASLFVGILSGALIYSNFNPWGMVTNTFEVMIGKISDGWNVGILVFLVALGMMVALINKAGGSAAYGRWASKRIKSRTGAIISTAVLGCLIFVDDYFNCLTVGSVMRPVTDRHKVSRAKLSYIIDATAAPICIIAPISSWAAAVSSVAPEGQGLTLFIQSIPYNLYALLTIFMVIAIALMKVDYGKMRVHELNAMNGDLYTTEARPYAGASNEEGNPKGTVLDLVLPIVALIVSCVLCMVYTGGFFDGVNFMDAFANCDASLGLVLGSVLALAFTGLLYLPRKIISFNDFSNSLSDGFKAMVPAILILVFAWTLSGVTGQLGATVYVAEFVRNSASSLANFLPAIVFLIGTGLAFATGTSWGTFGVLLPIVCSVFPSGELQIIAIAACLAGAVCGDHCSPISDTTIMASTGGQCDHINHVSTQLPYALTVAGVSFVGYVIAGFVQNAWIVLPLSLLMMFAVLMAIKLLQKKA